MSGQEEQSSSMWDDARCGRCGKKAMAMVHRVRLCECHYDGWVRIGAPAEPPLPVPNGSAEFTFECYSRGVRTRRTEGVWAVDSLAEALDAFIREIKHIRRVAGPVPTVDPLRVVTNADGLTTVLAEWQHEEEDQKATLRVEWCMPME